MAHDQSADASLSIQAQIEAGINWIRGHPREFAELVRRQDAKALKDVLESSGISAAGVRAVFLQQIGRILGDDSPRPRSGSRGLE